MKNLMIKLSLKKSITPWLLLLSNCLQNLQAICDILLSMKFSYMKYLFDLLVKLVYCYNIA